MPFDPEAFAKQLLEESDLPEEQKAAIRDAVKNPKVAKKAEELTMLRSDYSRNLDTHRQEQQKWDEEKGRYRDWYDEQKQKIEEFQRQNGGNPYRATPVAGNPNVMRTESGDFVSKKDIDQLKSTFDQRFEKQGEAFLGVLEDSLTMADDYRARFGERLPVAEVRELAVKHGITLAMAYDKYIQPKVEKAATESWEKKLEAAREEGRREGATRASNPAVGEGALADHPVFGKRELPAEYDKMTPEQRESASMQKFEQSWNKTHGFTTTQ